MSGFGKPWRYCDLTPQQKRLVDMTGALHVQPVTKANKYGARRTCGYASKLEADTAALYKILERAGEISDLREQPGVTLADSVRYKPDFSFIEKGVRVYADAKGVVTDRFRMICQLWPKYGPGPLRIMVRQPGGGITMLKEIKGGGQ
jgi:hypothetical protein